MRLRALGYRPSVALLLIKVSSMIFSEAAERFSGSCSNQQLVRAMTCKMYGAFAASVGVLALALSANAAAAGSGAAPRAAFAAPHPAHPGFARSFRHFHRRGGSFGAFTFWPGYDDFGNGFGYGSGSDGAPLVGGIPPGSNDVRYTTTYDVPWDWAHRFPPMVTPSDHPYVPGCHGEEVTVPGRDGAQRVVNVTRCY